MFIEKAESILNPSGKKVNTRLNTTLKLGEQHLYKFSNGKPIGKKPQKQYKKSASRSTESSKNFENKKYDQNSFDSFKNSSSYKKISDIVNGKKEVVVKVTGYSKGSESVHNNLLYVTRNHTIEVTNEKGETISEKDELIPYLHEYTFNSQNGRPRKDSRDTVHFSLSFPDADNDKLKAAVDKFAKTNFSNHEYLYALHHEEEGEPHIHLIVQTRSKDLTETLRINKPELEKYREDFAEILNELGEEATATNRMARGKFQRPRKQIEYHSKSKKIQALQLKSIKENIVNSKENIKLEESRAAYQSVLNDWKELAENLENFDNDLSKKINVFLEDKKLESRQEEMHKKINDNFIESNISNKVEESNITHDNNAIHKDDEFEI